MTEVSIKLLHEDISLKMKTKQQKSLKKKLYFSYNFIIAIMILPTFYSVIVSQFHTVKYQNIIKNVSSANRINQIAKVDIPGEIWEIVSGTKHFYEGNQYKLLTEMDNGLYEMFQRTKDKENRKKIQVALRTKETLYLNVNRLGEQIERGEKVSVTMSQMEEIRSISTLFCDIMQEFIVSEIESASKTNIALSKSSILLTVIQAVIIILVVLIAYRGLAMITDDVTETIDEMDTLSTKIAGGDLTARISSPKVMEFEKLSNNLNIMAEQIDLLIKQNIQEQKNLQKAEMKALQAQITPHFLYNTFDTIIWLAEEDKKDDVIRITRAFSEFLRISLSRGHEWITVQQELDHIKYYLTIQKVRYENILDYEIEADDALKDFPMLKLTLQPLVENAIYHGIKNKRGRGKLKVSARFADLTHTHMEFSVEDNGAGFTEERLAEVKKEMSLSLQNSENLNSVYGMYNVNKKLILYYNDTSSGLRIESEHNKGTKVSFVIPCNYS